MPISIKPLGHLSSAQLFSALICAMPFRPLFQFFPTNFNRFCVSKKLEIADKRVTLILKQQHYSAIIGNTTLFLMSIDIHTPKHSNKKEVNNSLNDFYQPICAEG